MDYQNPSKDVFKQQILFLLATQKKAIIVLFILVGAMFVLNPIGYNTPILFLMIMVLLILLALNKKDEGALKNG